MNHKIKTLLDLIRIRQPIGTILLILPCLLAFALIFKTKPEIELSLLGKYLLLFILGAFLMRSAGCIINDLFDKDFDKQVARTKNRPLASKQISTKNALYFLIFLLCLAFLILINFNKSTITAGLLALVLVGLYPLAKRFTHFPQIFLGITFNFGIILAYLALTNSIEASTIILYLACIFWTIGYDTIYAFQDIEDDMRIGIKSTAISFLKKNPKNILYRIFTIVILFFFMLGVIEEFAIQYYFLISFCGALIILKLSRCNLKKPSECLSFFKQNMIFGLIFLITILLS